MALLNEADVSTRLPCKTPYYAENVMLSTTALTCLVCGSRSLLNVARMFGGNLPQNRAIPVSSEAQEMQREIVLSFPRRHGRRVKAIG